MPRYRVSIRKADNGKITHGMRSHYLYDVWRQMLRRCYDEKSPKFQSYGGRGITVDIAWHRVEVFISDIERLLGPRPDNHSLDRKDNDGNYCPTNIKWSSATEQSRNVRTNRMITIDGITKCAAEWAEEYSIPYWTFHGRLRRGVSGTKLLAKVRPLKKGK